MSLSGAVLSLTARQMDSRHSHQTVFVSMIGTGLSKTLLHLAWYCHTSQAPAPALYSQPGASPILPELYHPPVAGSDSQLGQSWRKQGGPH